MPASGSMTGMKKYSGRTQACDPFPLFTVFIYPRFEAIVLSPPIHPLWESHKYMSIYVKYNSSSILILKKRDNCPKQRPILDVVKHLWLNLLQELPDTPLLNIHTVNTVQQLFCLDNENNFREHCDLLIRFKWAANLFFLSSPANRTC